MKNLINKEVYIVECQNFIYYPKVAHIIGFGGDYQCTYYYLDYKEFTGEDKKISEFQIEQYKTYEECLKECKRLNNIPKNKKMAEDWNSVKTQTQLNILKGLRNE